MSADYKHLSTHDRRHSREPVMDCSPTFVLILQAITLGLIFVACLQ